MRRRQKFTQSFSKLTSHRQDTSLQQKQRDREAFKTLSPKALRLKYRELENNHRYCKFDLLCYLWLLLGVIFITATFVISPSAVEVFVEQSTLNKLFCGGVRIVLFAIDIATLVAVVIRVDRLIRSGSRLRLLRKYLK